MSTPVETKNRSEKDLSSYLRRSPTLLELVRVEESLLYMDKIVMHSCSTLKKSLGTELISKGDYNDGYGDE